MTGLVAPANAVEARLVFRFVTGAVTGGLGEAWIDDVALDSGSGSGNLAQTHFLTLTPQPVVRISWPTTAGTHYQPVSTTDLAAWSYLLPAITGDGGTKAFTVQPNVDSGIVALYNASTVLEPATTVDTPTARITYIADRARDRHARESGFELDGSFRNHHPPATGTRGRVAFTSMTIA